MSNFKTAVCFHVQFAQFLNAIDIKLIVDSCRFIAAANIVFIAKRFAYNLFPLFTGCVFY